MQPCPPDFNPQTLVIYSCLPGIDWIEKYSLDQLHIESKNAKPIVNVTEHELSNELHSLSVVSVNCNNYRSSEDGTN